MTFLKNFSSTGPQQARLAKDRKYKGLILKRYHFFPNLVLILCLLVLSPWLLPCLEASQEVTLKDNAAVEKTEIEEVEWEALPTMISSAVEELKHLFSSEDDNVALSTVNNDASQVITTDSAYSDQLVEKFDSSNTILERIHGYFLAASENIEEGSPSVENALVAFKSLAESSEVIQTLFSSDLVASLKAVDPSVDQHLSTAFSSFNNGMREIDTLMKMFQNADFLDMYEEEERGLMETHERLFGSSTNNSTRQKKHQRRIKRRLFPEDATNEKNGAEHVMRAMGYHGYLLDDHQMHGPSFLSSFDDTFAGSDGFQHPHQHASFSSNFQFSHSMIGGRRLTDDGFCKEPNPAEQKLERCQRLKQCAKRYSTYDLLVYFYGDDITDEGEADNRPVQYDDRNVKDKLSFIKSEGDCNVLLNQFHRVDEAKATNGKWTAGTLTDICRGWGSSKNLSFTGMYNLFSSIGDLVEKITVTGGSHKEPFPTRMSPEPNNNDDDDGFTEAAGYDSSQIYELHPPTVGDGCFLLQFRTSDEDGAQTSPASLTGFKFSTDDAATTTTLNAGCYMAKGAKCEHKICNKEELLIQSFWTSTTDNAKRTPDYWEFTLEDKDALDNVADEYRRFENCVKRISDHLRLDNPLRRSGDLQMITGIKTNAARDRHGKPLDGSTGLYNYEKFPNDHDFNSDYLEKLDSTKNALFGEKTTVGQVCSYANALEGSLVEGVPGYCCLDIPSQIDLGWGENYACAYEYGPKKGQARPKGECKRTGPWWAGFNEASCDEFSGTWCPNPRKCDDLVKCISTLRDDSEKDKTRKAFHEYLKEAPEVTDLYNNNECGNLRVYFEYDADFPDDDRICREVESLQCRNDFENLDNLGENTGSGESTDLVLNTNLEFKEGEYFKRELKLIWAGTNAVLNASFQLLDGIHKTMVQKAPLIPMSVAEITGTAMRFSALTILTAKSILKIIVKVLKVIAKTSTALYNFMVTKPDLRVDREIRVATYKNVITSAQNIFTTFRAIQQVKDLIGDVSDDINEIVDIDTNGRRLSETCEKNAICSDSNSQCSCDDPKYKCDCTPNFDFIVMQPGAGCDDFDSSGDGIKDNCEDKVPPKLILKNPDNFRCDINDLEKICYTSQVFQKVQHGKNFLGTQVKIADDCAKSFQRGLSIEKVGGECSETEYSVTPYQEYEGCDDSVNMNGENKTIFLNVDDQNPIVECGFHDIHQGNVGAHVEGNVLYYYAGMKDDNELEVSNFFYKASDNCDSPLDVEVSISSNEKQEKIGFRDMASLYSYQFQNVVEQVEVLFAPTSCDIQSYNSLTCLKDIGISPRIRLYDIDVTVTDSANRKDSAQCRIIIVPPCNNSGSCEVIGGKSYVTRSVAKAASNASRIRYKLGSLTTQWSFDENLAQDFVDLHAQYNSRLVRSEAPSTLPSVSPTDEPSTIPSSSPSLLPSSQPSSEPSLLPSSAPSNIPSDIPSDQPSLLPSSIPSDVPSDIPSDLPSDQPSSLPSSMPSDTPSDTPSDQPSSLPSSIPSDKPSLSPSSSPSLEPSGIPSTEPSTYPTFVPVIECGFKDVDHVNIVHNKTLFFYTDFDYRKGLQHSHFFYRVTDKSTDLNKENNVVFKVRSNEMEMGATPMTNLTLIDKADTVQQVEFQFLANDCDDLKSKSKESVSCLDDPSIETSMRFYEINVQVTDVYGRSDDDTCNVIIVPKCKSKYDNCSKYSEHYQKYRGEMLSNGGKGGNYGHSYPKGYYFNLDYLSTVAQSSTNLNGYLNTMHLIWNFASSSESPSSVPSTQASSPPSSVSTQSPSSTD